MSGVALLSQNCHWHALGSTMVTCTMHGRMMILLQKQQLVHKGRSRDQIMQDVPDNVLGRGDRHN